MSMERLKRGSTYCRAQVNGVSVDKEVAMGRGTEHLGSGSLTQKHAYLWHLFMRPLFKDLVELLYRPSGA